MHSKPQPSVHGVINGFSTAYPLGCSPVVPVIASSVPTLEPTLMNETNTAVIARLGGVTQIFKNSWKKMRTGGVLDPPVKPGDDSFDCGGRLTKPQFLPRSTCPP